MDYERMLQAILDIGEEMIACGAEVSRAQDSIERMCRSYGCKRINVFIITSNIQVTLESPDGRIITQIRMMVRYSVNFDQLDDLNNLSRYICSHTPTPEEIQKELKTILDKPTQNKWIQCLGAVLVASGFTVFFGGNYLDAIASGIMGAIIMITSWILAPRENNAIVFNFISSVIGGAIALLLVHFGLGVNSDKIMIGGIMLLIPGIPMTNAIRDMLIGDIASGLLRFFNSVLIATAIAGGFAVAIIGLGVILR